MDLRLGLALLGAVVVAAVGIVTYDRGRTVRRFSGRRKPEPKRRGSGRPAPANEQSVPERIMREDGNGGRVVYGRRWLESHKGEPPSHLATPPVVSERKVSNCKPDEVIDFIVRLPGREPVARDQVLGLYKQDESLLEKPHHLCGLRFGTSLSADLETEAADGQYSDLVLSIQLADHRGPVTESELNRVSQIGLKLADALQRAPQFSIGFEEALQRAAELDKFCAAFDVIAHLNIVADANEGFPGEAIRDAALAEGMDFGPRNIFHLRDPVKADRALFSMASLFKPGHFDPTAWPSFRTKGLTLFLNVPCVEDPKMAFERMVEVARRLAEKLHGFLLDQERKPLTEASLGLIRVQIERIVSGMDRYSIGPGSPRAIRLFDS